MWNSLERNVCMLIADFWGTFEEDLDDDTRWELIGLLPWVGGVVQFRENKPQDFSVGELATKLRVTALRELVLPGIGLVGLEFAALAAQVVRGNEFLERVVLDGNGFGDEGCLVLADALVRSPRMRALSLRKTGVGETGLFELGEKFLKDSKTMELVDLSENDMNSACGFVLAGILGQNARLDHLVLDGNQIGEEALFQLFHASTRLTSLSIDGRSVKRKEIDYNAITNGSECVVDDDDEARLTHLYGSENPHISKCLTSISTYGTNIRELHLSHSCLKDSNLNMLLFGDHDELKGSNLINLEVLNLSDNLFRQRGCEILGMFLQQRGVKVHTLNIARNELKSCFGPLSLALKSNQTVKSLDICSTNLQDDGLYCLAEALKENTTLEQIDMDWNNITCYGGKQLGGALYVNKSLQRVSLLKNKIGIHGARVIADGLKQNTTLRFLNLQQNRLGPEGAYYLFQGIVENKTLETLILKGNDIGNKAGAYIASLLPKMTGLKHLDLDWNFLSLPTVKSLCKSLHQSQTLQLLSLSHNSIGSAGGKLLLECLKVGETSVTHLELSKCDMDESTQIELEKLSTIFVKL